MIASLNCLVSFTLERLIVSTNINPSLAQSLRWSEKSIFWSESIMPSPIITLSFSISFTYSSILKKLLISSISFFFALLTGSIAIFSGMSAKYPRVFFIPDTSSLNPSTGILITGILSCSSIYLASIGAAPEPVPPSVLLMIITSSMYCGIISSSSSGLAFNHCTINCFDASRFFAHPYSASASLLNMIESSCKSTGISFFVVLIRQACSFGTMPSLIALAKTLFPHPPKPKTK